MPKFEYTPKPVAKAKKNSPLAGSPTTDAPLLTGIKSIGVSGLGVGKDPDSAQVYSCLKCGTSFAIMKQRSKFQRVTALVTLNIICPVCHSPIGQ